MQIRPIEWIVISAIFAAFAIGAAFQWFADHANAVVSAVAVIMAAQSIYHSIFSTKSVVQKRIWMLFTFVMAGVAIGFVFIKDSENVLYDRTLRQSISDIKTLLESQQNLTPDQIIVAAAAKLRAQDKRILELEKKAADREIPEDTQQAIIALLWETPAQHVEVGYDGNGDDAEQVRFSEKIRKLFIAGGWSPGPAGGRIDLTRPALVGVHFYFKDPQTHIPEYAANLFRLFDNAGLIVDRTINYAKYLPDNESITVLAGHDPKK